MAVFTTVTAASLAPWLAANYGLELTGEPDPVAEGIENTNYRIECAGTGRLMFTVVEVWDFAMATFCLRLASHFHAHGLPVPEVLPTLAGQRCASHGGKPAALVRFVDGATVDAPDADACRALGATLGALHEAALSFRAAFPNQRGAAWRTATAARVRDRLDAGDLELLDAGLACDQAASTAALPQAASHCDLFRNNVLWHDGRIAAVIDFYFAGVDRLGFDLAVAANDWCMVDDALDVGRLQALMAGYRTVRALDDATQRALPDLFAAAALRFWLSRQLDLLDPRPAAALVAHDPRPFRDRLRSVLAHARGLAEL